MPPKNTQEQRTKHATFILDQVIALGIPFTFNINDLATNLGLSVSGAKSRIREVKKHNPELKLSFTSTGKSSAGPLESNRGSTADNAPKNTPATATRSGRGRKKQGADGVELAGVADDDEEVHVGADVSTAILKKPKSKPITGGKKRTTRSSSKATREDASDSNGGDITQVQEAKQKTPRTRAGRRSAGLEEDEQVSLPVHAPNSRHAASNKAKMRVEKEEAEDSSEDVSHDSIADGTGLEEEAVEQDSMDESAAVGNNAFVERLLDGTSTHILGSTKRKRSIPPQAPSPTLSWMMLESSDLMPSSDLLSTPDSTKKRIPAAAAAQGDTPSKPPPAKKAKLDAADAAAVKQATDDVSGPAAVAETNVAGGVAGDSPDMEVDETADSSVHENQLFSATSGTVAEQGLEPGDTNQVSHRDLVESVELATPPLDKKAFARRNIMEGEREENAEMTRVGAENGITNASESTSPVDKATQMHARERRSQFFSNPLRWMSYSREARPAEPPNAFEASVDDEGRPCPQRQG
ncbi:hypothetical protein LTR70_003084 [Exophiala xenobiotica]|uniref:Uncharacterized protein n=1 Tax=Lithohypha guttulata TaxID=1690604 RepID=A0ABR0KH99_9EURO|nr:hypothetical protein LTR24_002683 [Lithohypha guttulata]KAK5323795.1 hypothetical protein LTR70_003084 [Exophiala xenobiotica]